RERSGQPTTAQSLRQNRERDLPGTMTSAKRMARVVVCAMLLLLGWNLAVLRTAHAQDVATSAALFKKGVDDMSAGRYDTACPSPAEGLGIDPRPGTLFTLAECYNKAGKIASAVARYREYSNKFSSLTPEQQAKQGDRPQVAQQQASALEPQVPQLTLKLPS